MWLSFVPLLVIGVFLAIIWDTISPVRFVQQMRRERAEKRNAAKRKGRRRN